MYDYSALTLLTKRSLTSTWRISAIWFKVLRSGWTFWFMYLDTVQLLLPIYSLSQRPVLSFSAKTTFILLSLRSSMFIRFNFRTKVINLYEKDGYFWKKVTQSPIISLKLLYNATQNTHFRRLLSNYRIKHIWLMKRQWGSSLHILHLQ